MLGGSSFGERRRKVSLGNKPRILVGTAVGTLATFVLFVKHYTEMLDDSGQPARK